MTFLGAGGGGGAAWWFNPPLAADFALISGDATNLTLVDDDDAGLLIDGGAPVTGDKSRFAYKTLTNKNLDWDMVVRSDYFIREANYGGVGIACRDSIGGRMMSVCLRGGSNWINVIKWNGLVGYNSTPFSFNQSRGVPVHWFRIKKAGTALTFYISTDGKQWLQCFTETATTFLANNPDQVGIVVDYNRSTAVNSIQAISYFSLTGTAV